ncbi:trimethylamine N-oxide reductase system protein TorE [Photobacterium sanguinicancri]|uniref:Trimethylamine N-oxide reductase system protein TorE n=1 Tax=Photobacterium sanguinicancri TaxID=875932 RepID=A0AAW7XYL0_9GAMM|nr:trimethylamine N-oxide reductase system protein TorE [Photobacterium sanguinicancri]KXI23833.1 NapE protein [Photobacterium sanguinicancri]MDO6497115.1 trimethylamine N-oxide reductase system protein TorE [Photobacterium sanguinicancri]MDO6541216.1 trimethylamine N-oxide reductase system protein TorE [Photobacterium sanguinicancri]OZS45822.1 trimethylamine N-oxide reductase system protein TorE [Photobacterium sanguinicancri]
MSNQEPLKEEERGKYEWRSFIFITVFLFPILAVALVGGYGFIVWMLQIFFLGPPGHG